MCNAWSSKMTDYRKYCSPFPIRLPFLSRMYLETVPVSGAGGAVYKLSHQQLVRSVKRHKI